MKIRYISLFGVMTHRKTIITLPETGVVLVTGPNGAGKSAIVEAVSVACWGEPLRKKPVWAGEESYVEVEDFAGLTVHRHHKGKKTTLTFDETDYETTTKAQAALERIVGSHDLWRRTSAFSSQDADHFTLAPDSARKKLLEDILGLDRFDRALAACRTDLKAAERAHAQADRKLELDVQRKEATKLRLRDAQERLADLPVLAPVPSLATLERQIEEHKNKRDAALRACAEADRAVSVAHAEVTRFKIRGIDTECRACGKPLSKAEVARQKADAAAAEEKLEDATIVCRKANSLADPIVKVADEGMAELHELRGELRAESREYARVEAQRETLGDAIVELGQAYEEACDTVDEGRSGVATLATEVGVLTATEQVLSLTGVRAHLLASAIESVEEIANSWLLKLTGKLLRLHLTPYTETASGNVRDSISLEVEGAGGGHGYRAASGGERRRIDIALMLALGQIAGYAAGADPGTIFFDEVFDALDAVEGVPAAADVLRDLSTTRCVVVVTHNSDLAQVLRPKLTLRVEAGKVTEV